MVREFKNDNGITYEIVAENKELDRTLLCNWSDDGRPRYTVVGSLDWNDLSDELFVENVELYYDPKAGRALWIDVSPDPRD